jgi:hypothetical protein
MLHDKNYDPPKKSDLKEFTSETDHHFLAYFREHYITIDNMFEATTTNHVMQNEAMTMADHVIRLVPLCCSVAYSYREV